MSKTQWKSFQFKLKMVLITKMADEAGTDNHPFVPFSVPWTFKEECADPVVEFGQEMATVDEQTLLTEINQKEDGSQPLVGKKRRTRRKRGNKQIGNKFVASGNLPSEANAECIGVLSRTDKSALTAAESPLPVRRMKRRRGCKRGRKKSTTSQGDPSTALSDRTASITSAETSATEESSESMSHDCFHQSKP
jgi:hypothetical protein